MSRPTKHRMSLNSGEVEVRFIRTAQRKRTIALQIAPDGGIAIRAPLRTPLARMEEVVRSKSAWIDARLSGRLGEIPYPSPPKEFVAGESYFHLGRQHRLQITIAQKSDRVALDGDFLRVTVSTRRKLTRDDIRERLKTWFAKQAKEFLPARAVRWCEKLGTKDLVRVLVTDQTRRWASCGRGAVLRFNWRLMGAPVSLIDYVIVHELCHLRHPDHSPAFWRELRRVMPDYPQREQQLFALGTSLGF